MTYTTVTQKWQMTIPKEIRTLLGLDAPGRVMLNVNAKTKQLTIEPVEDILDLAGKFKAPKGMTALKARQMMENEYERV